MEMEHIKKIFILLGSGCNLSCAYCLQHPLIQREITRKVQPKLYSFLEELGRKQGKVPLLFYGGEPLVYFPIIKEIVEETKRRNISCTYAVITNAKALTDSMVEFFNCYDFSVTVSWDGPHVKETRGFDAFDKRNPLRRRILRLEKLAVSAVISSKAYPLEVLEAIESLDKEYRALGGNGMGVNLDLVFDTGLPSKELLQMNQEKLAHEMETLTSEWISHCVEEKSFSRIKNLYMIGLLRQLHRWVVLPEKRWKGNRVYCGNGYSVLNVDLEGNLYSCHNVRTPIGSVDGSYETYMERVKKEDPTAERSTACMKCNAVAFCQGGCKLVSDIIRKESYCKMKQAMYGTVYRVFHKMAKEEIT